MVRAGSKSQRAAGSYLTVLSSGTAAEGALPLCGLRRYELKAWLNFERRCMRRLPHLDRAVVTEAKIVNYLLSARHPGGRAKARFLESFGFRAQDWHRLRDALVAHATANDIAASHQTRFGTRYEIDGPLPTPSGRTPMVRVVWFVESQENVPRLVTLVPRRMVPS